MLQTHLGEQDWLTLVQFESPELVHLLSCRYNRQLGRDYEMGPWLEMFPYFHECGEDEDGREEGRERDSTNMIQI
jgi:hypothetical protein